MSTQRTEAGLASRHYLGHVVASAQWHDVQAAQDIVAVHGLKLLAKGQRIDAHAAQRLLEHELRLPLEACVQVEGGLTPEALALQGEALLEQYPLLSELCAGMQQPAPVALAKLKLSPAAQSLLTVYAEHRSERLQHMVGVAMLSQSLARKLHPGQVERQRMIALAGLAHDVGELYVDPVHWRPDTPLSPAAWREIANHPQVAYRVLGDIAGCGAPVAEAVLQHHERADGFGYPRQLVGGHFTLDGQIVAVAEWVMALIESGFAPHARAAMAGRLVPGEFSPALLHVVASAARHGHGATAELDAAMLLHDAAAPAARIALTLQRFRDALPLVESRMTQGGPLRVALQTLIHRASRIHAYAEFSLDGVDVSGSGPRDPQQRLELFALLREIEWRWGQLERHAALCAWLLGEQDTSVLRELLNRWMGDDAVTPAV